MSEIYKSVITNLGLSLLANAQVTGTKVNITHMALGDSNGSYYEPLPNATALRNERCRVPITSYYKSPKNETMLTIDAVVGADVPPAFTVREIALFDNQGNMITIGKVPATEKAEPSSGAATDLYFKVNIQLAHAANISITLDPLTSVATIGYVDAVVKVARDSTDALNGDFNTWLGEDYSPFKTDFTQHKEQNASTTQNGHVQLSNDTNSTSETLAPTMKALNEVKLYANDIKTKWANVVGSPLVSTDTQAQLESKTQAIKNALVTNLATKGQSGVGTDTLANLVAKVASIPTGKRFAMGTKEVTMAQQNFNYYNGNGSRQSYFLTATGLGFTPKVVIALSFAHYDINYNDLVVYLDKSVHSNFQYNIAMQSSYSGDSNSSGQTKYRTNEFAANSFTIPVSNVRNYFWFAFE